MFWFVDCFHRETRGPSLPLSQNLTRRGTLCGGSSERRSSSQQLLQMNSEIKEISEAKAQIWTHQK